MFFLHMSEAGLEFCFGNSIRIIRSTAIRLKAPLLSDSILPYPTRRFHEHNETKYAQNDTLLLQCGFGCAIMEKRT